MHIDVVTLFPELVLSVGQYGVTGRAIDRELLSLQATTPRDYTDDVHRSVDDRPYGGGPGMLLKVEPMRRAIQALRERHPAAPVIYLSPQGRRFDQAEAARIAGLDSVILLAGHYEGIDERIVERDVDQELSLGDYVLSGGELGAMVVIDTVARLLPGALGDAESTVSESFSENALEGPQYTRPDEVDGQRVPEVLLSGDHAKIARWRRKQSLGRTAERRPDLLHSESLCESDSALLQEYISELTQAD